MHRGAVAIGGDMVVAVVFGSQPTCVFTHMCLHLVVSSPLVVVLVAGRGVCQQPSGGRELSQLDRWDG